MKRLLPILLPMLFLIFFSKNESTNPNTEQSNFLVKNNFNIGKWKLTVLKVSTVIQWLTTAPALYEHRYSADLSCSDTDSLVGKLCMPTSNTLVEVYINFNSGRIYFPDI